MRPMVKTLVWFFVLIALAGAGGLAFMSAKASAPGETFVVTQGTVKRSIRGTGRLEGVGETPLSFPFTGQIENVYFREGQEVTLNDTLAELNPAHMEKMIEQFSAKLKEAEAQLELVKTPVSEDIVRQYEEKVKQAEESVKGARAKLESLKLPLEPIRTPQWQIDDAQREVDERKLLLQQANLELKRVSSSIDETSQRVAEEKVNVAQTQLDKAKADIEINGTKPVLFGGKLEKGQLEAEVTKADAALRLAKAERDLMLKPARPDELQAQQLKIKLAETALMGSEAKLKRLMQQEAAPKVPVVEIKQAEYAIALAEAAKRESEAKLDESKRGTDPAKIRAAEASVERATKEMEAAKLNKDGLKIRAPRDGMITKCIAEPGMLASAFTPMFYIVDFSQKRVRAEMDISRLTELRKELPVTVSSRALGRETLDGHILEIGRVGPRRLTSDDPSAPKGGDIVEVIVALDPPKSDVKKAIYDSLRPNVPAEVEIHLERRDKVLVIPRSYVSSLNGQEQIQLLPRNADGKSEAPRTHPVRTGLKDETYVEILEGLSEGDRVMKPMTQSR